METKKHIARRSSGLNRASAAMTRSPSLAVLLTLLLCSACPANLNAQQQAEAHHGRHDSLEVSPSGVGIRRFDAPERSEYPYPVEGGGGCIKEVIPVKYKRSYQKWKKEFLATASGHRQWEIYSHHPRLVLTITVSGNERNGATTDNFAWDDSGNLIAATITLGHRLDQGCPGPAYYPVLSSLKPFVESGKIGDHILAAAKLAHEFGHVNQIVIADGTLYRRQSQLIPLYNAILLSNGHNIGDPQLTALTRDMGSTPIEILENREYWAEADAMRYLSDGITKESLRRSLFTLIKQNAELYARRFEGRFNQIAASRSRNQSQSSRLPTTVGNNHFDR